MAGGGTVIKEIRSKNNMKFAAGDVKQRLSAGVGGTKWDDTYQCIGRTRSGIMSKSLCSVRSMYVLHTLFICLLLDLCHRTMKNKVHWYADWSSTLLKATMRVFSC